MVARMQSTHTHRFIDFILTMYSTEKLQVRIIAFHFAQSTRYHIYMPIFILDRKKGRRGGDVGKEDIAWIS